MKLKDYKALQRSIGKAAAYAAYSAGNTAPAATPRPVVERPRVAPTVATPAARAPVPPAGPTNRVASTPQPMRPVSATAHSSLSDIQQRFVAIGFAWQQRHAGEPLGEVELQRLRDLIHMGGHFWRSMREFELSGHLLRDDSTGTPLFTFVPKGIPLRTSDALLLDQPERRED